VAAGAISPNLDPLTEMRTEPRIRSAAAADAPTIAALLGELGYPADARSVAARLAPLLPRGDMAILVAELEGAVVGLGSVFLLPVLHENGARAMITALVVSESTRRRGVGRLLVRSLQAFARENGCTRIIVTTANHRADAHQFYEDIGFSWTGRRYGSTLG
jgi:GNAT superfamily N-acetyltransferase